MILNAERFYFAQLLQTLALLSNNSKDGRQIIQVGDEGWGHWFLFGKNSFKYAYYCSNLRQPWKKRNQKKLIRGRFGSLP